MAMCPRYGAKTFEADAKFIAACAGNAEPGWRYALETTKLLLDPHNIGDRSTLVRQMERQLLTEWEPAMYNHPACVGELRDTDPLPFGAYFGTPVQDVPEDYLRWFYHTFSRERRGCALIQYIRNVLRIDDAG